MKDSLKNFFWRSIQVFGKQGVSFVIIFLSAKFLTKEDFGVFSYVMAIGFFIALIGDFGISTSTTNYVAKYNNDKKIIGKVLFNSLFVIVLVCIFLSFSVFIFGPALFKEYYYYILLLIPIIFFSPLVALYDGVYRALGYFKKSSVIFFISGIFSLTLSYFLITKHGLVGAFLSQSFFYVISFVLLFIFYINIKLEFNKKIIKEIFKYSIILGTISLTYFLFTKINTIILGRSGYITEVAYYELITKTIIMVLMPFTIISQVIAPQITRIFFSGDVEKIAIVYKKIIAISLLFGLLIFIGFVTLFPLFVKNIIPQYYDQSILSFYIFFISISLVTQGAGIIASNGFSIATGHAKLNLNILFFLAPLNLILAFIALSFFGFKSFLITISVVQLFADIFFIYFYLRKIKNS